MLPILTARQRDRGATRLSGIPARAGSSSGAPGRDRTTAPCPPPQATRAPAARCAGWRRARSPRPSSTTTRRRRGRRAPPHARSSTGGASTTTSRARRGASTKPWLVALTSASARSSTRSRPTSTRNRARCDSSACFARKARATSALLGTSPGQASPSARASANKTGRVASETTSLSSRTTWRHASTTSAPDARSASTSSSRSGRSSPRAIRRAAGASSTRDALVDLRRQGRDVRLARCVLGPGERLARRLRPQAPDRDPATASSRATRNAGGRGAGSSSASVCSASSRRPISSRRRTSRLRACAAFNRSPCASSVARAAPSAFAGHVEVARDERDLGLGDDASRAGHRLLRTERARGTSQECLRANEIAELRHRDAAQRERRRIVTQGDPLQGAEGIACRECARRSGDQRVHRNPVTLVTPTVRYPGAS